MNQNDQSVGRLSTALENTEIDLIISGSIGSVESIRLIRQLRRLGAQIFPYLSKGGQQFITPTAVSWAACRETVTSFRSMVDHVATRKYCVIAPCSANMLNKIATGLADCPSSANALSHLGQGNAVIVVPNMHMSMATSPATQQSIERLKQIGVQFVATRNEEGKWKFPEPLWLANEIAHIINARRYPKETGEALITMGSTKGYIDDVRYISNYSSGALGTKISEELYRRGFITHVICGAAKHQPTNFSHFYSCETNDAMESQILSHRPEQIKAAIFLASVLDFKPREKLSGKIKSSTPPEDIKLEKTNKLIRLLTPASGLKVGFKLETETTEEYEQEIAKDYFHRYDLSMLVLNKLNQVDENAHTAKLFSKNPDASFKFENTFGKEQIANKICDHLMANPIG